MQTQRLLETFLAKVEKSEPGCELFLLNRDDERFQYVTYEMYADLVLQSYDCTDMTVAIRTRMLFRPISRART